MSILLRLLKQDAPKHLFFGKVTDLRLIKIWSLRMIWERDLLPLPHKIHLPLQVPQAQQVLKIPQVNKVLQVPQASNQAQQVLKIPQVNKVLQVPKAYQASQGHQRVLKLVHQVQSVEVLKAKILHLITLKIHPILNLIHKMKKI